MEFMKKEPVKKIFNGISIIEMIAPNQFRMVATSGEMRYFNGKGELHREDGPAVKDKYGNRYWYFNGLLHREGGPAVMEIVHEPRLSNFGPKMPSGDKILKWYRHGLLHREDGPAVIYPDQRSIWFPNGRKHEAVERVEKGYSSWRINGEPVDPPEQKAAQTTKPRGPATP
jgi:hypothetical protein